MYNLIIQERPTKNVIKELSYQDKSKAISDAHYFWNLLDFPAKKNHRVFVCECSDKYPFCLWPTDEAILYLSLDIPS